MMPTFVALYRNCTLSRAAEGDAERVAMCVRNRRIGKFLRGWHLLASNKIVLERLDKVAVSARRKTLLIKALGALAESNLLKNAKRRLLQRASSHSRRKLLIGGNKPTPHARHMPVLVPRCRLFSVF